MNARIPTKVLHHFVLPVLMLALLSPANEAQAGPPIQVTASGDDGEWAEIVPASPSSARYDHSAIYDPSGNRMIVFGGFDSNSGTLADVWELALWGSDDWSPITPAGTPPTPRYKHQAIYDPLRERMIVSGGRLYPEDAFEVWSLSLGETPEWSQLSPLGTGPPELDDHTAIHDPVRDRMLVFGSNGVFGGYGLWALTLSDPPAWTLLTPSGTLPSGRGGHTAIYDPGAGPDAGIRRMGWRPPQRRVGAGTLGDSDVESAHSDRNPASGPLGAFRGLRSRTRPDGGFRREERTGDAK